MSLIETLDKAIVEGDRISLVYAQVIEFAINEFKYLQVFGDAETKARAKAAELYISTRTKALYEASEE